MHASMITHPCICDHAGMTKLAQTLRPSPPCKHVAAQLRHAGIPLYTLLMLRDAYRSFMPFVLQVRARAYYDCLLQIIRNCFWYHSADTSGRAIRPPPPIVAQAQLIVSYTADFLHSLSGVLGKKPLQGGI